MQKTKKRIKPDNIFIALNIIALVAIIIIYLTRLLHYYKLEHPKIESLVNKELVDALSSDANVVFEGDGLYKTGDTYTFRGQDLKNYVYYSGRLWRITKINSDKSIRLITEEPQTSIAWGINNNYEESYINNWLNINDEDEMSGIFYKSLTNPEDFLTEGTFCKDILDGDTITCDDTIKAKIGLLSYSEYESANGEKSFLNNNTNYWTMNGNNKATALYVTADGSLSNITKKQNTYISLGVRPVINIKGNLAILSGDGSINNPYVIEKESGNTLQDKAVGEYVKYSNYTFRILEKNESDIRLVMDGYILKENAEVLELFSTKTNKYSADNSQIGYYLNKEFYESLENNENIVESKWQTGQYNSYVKFDYTNTNYRTVNAKIGLLKVGDLFTNDYNNYAMLTGESAITGTIYTINEDGLLEDISIKEKMHIRPCLNLKGDLVIESGNGHKNNPYVIK